MKVKKYNSFYELETDVKWMLHTWIVNFQKKTRVMGLIGKLIEFIKNEVDSIKTCRQCYVNVFTFPDESFAMVCDPPHLIIWAKYTDYCYWPSKVMNTTDQMVHVRFFGDHLRGTILRILSLCLLNGLMNGLH